MVFNVESVMSAQIVESACMEPYVASLTGVRRWELIAGRHQRHQPVVQYHMSVVTRDSVNETLEPVYMTVADTESIGHRCC